MVAPHIQKTIDPEASVAKAFNIIKTSRARFLPVVDAAGKYVGVFTAPTLLKLILPKAATINMGSESTSLGQLGYLSMSEQDFVEQLDTLRHEKVRNNMSLPKNIPIAAPDTPVMEGIFLIHKYKRHLILVEPDTGKFVGTVSANSILDRTLSDAEIEE